MRTLVVVFFALLGCGAREPFAAQDAATDASSADAGADAPALWIAPDGCNGATPGTMGATFMGVAAYCQPSSGTGFYQCDELANRFMRDALKHPNLDDVVTQFASSICAAASTSSAYSAWGPAFRATNGHAPVPGDLVVWSGSPGHVAVVVDWADATSLRVVQQNELPVVRTLAWDAGAAFIDGAECWVHAEPAPPAPAPSGTACGCFDGDGDYCGLAIVDHAWWNDCSAPGAIDYDTLYACFAGSFAPKEACSSGCVTAVMTPALGACR